MDLVAAITWAGITLENHGKQTDGKTLCITDQVKLCPRNDCIFTTLIFKRHFPVFCSSKTKKMKHTTGCITDYGCKVCECGQSLFNRIIPGLRDVENMNFTTKISGSSLDSQGSKINIY